METFQSAYSGTNPMGFKQISFSQPDNLGQWSGWSHLTPGGSFVNPNNSGLDVRDLNPNFGFVVIS